MPLQVVLIIITGLLVIVTGVRLYLNWPELDAVDGFLTAIIALLTYFSTRKNKEPRQPGENLKQYHRRMLINTVENWWIKGVLAKSLHGLAMMELGVEENPDAVNRAWGIRQESTGQLLPSDMGIAQIFEQVGGGRSLLILGEPGAGKTTMLLDLARRLIRQAREDETKPIPVVLNLSTWRGKKPGLFGGLLGRDRPQTFEEWLTDQLQQGYRWSNPDLNQYFLLLDGLDEVGKGERRSCVEAINQFRESYGMVPLVICCRKEDYEKIGLLLDMEGAITLQPLERDQVDQYLQEAGETLSGVREALVKDETLYELLNTPLMLSVMTLAYQGASPVELATLLSIEDRRKQLFDTYIGRMFTRDRKIESKYSCDKIESWLSFLAYNMCIQESTVFDNHDMQPFWLQTTRVSGLYVAMMMVIVALVVGLSFGLVFSPLTGGIVGTFFALVWGRILWISELSETVFKIDLKGAWKLLGNESLCLDSVGLIGGLLGGLYAGEFFVRLISIFGLDKGLNYGLSNGLWIWLRAVPTVVICIVALGMMIRAVESAGLIDVLISIGLFKGKKEKLLGGFLVGLSESLLSGLLFGWGIGMSIGLGGGLLVFGLNGEMNTILLIGGLSIGLLVGISAGGLGEVFVLLFGIVCILGSIIAQLVGFLSGMLSIEVSGALKMEILGGLLVGILIGSFYGISASFQYALLRTMLHLTNNLPWRLNRFLDYAVDLVFMRKVGKDYEFVHVLLRDHFAKRYVESFRAGTR